MANLKIIQNKEKTEIYLDDKPVELNRLIGVNLDMNSERGNLLTLEYVVDDVNIEADNVVTETEILD